VTPELVDPVKISPVSLVSKTRVPGYHVALLAISAEHRLVTDGETDTQ